MCLPILPNTSHPTGRKPIKLSKPLPFENCYTHSHVSPATVRARSTKRTYGDAIMIPFTESIRDQSEATEDLQRMEELQEMRGFRTELDGELDDESTILTPQETDEEDETERSEQGDMALNPLDILGLVLAVGIPDDSVTAITNISYNLEECPDFAQPSEFYEEVEQLTRLIKDAKACAIERAKRIDEEMYGLDETCKAEQPVPNLPIYSDQHPSGNPSPSSLRILPNLTPSHSWSKPWAKLKALFV
ncbi:hypothetical protein BDN72DRAFT_819218 [Pluteus cervinus]|uniref:Uncharacterized protein n=1 Tax=Pluteus cervinus TaxID=181527 RepID=A0ACD3AWN6_9AGAR|nr:hypothetical protein BDN72DRAFT_819218 [Pluteus cervinus]